MAKSISSVLAALSFLLTICGLLYAQPPVPGYWYPPSGHEYANYAVIKGGIFEPRGDLKRLDTGFNGELAYGFRFTRYVALEYSTGYLDTDGAVRSSLGRSGLSFDGNVYAIPLTFAVKISLPVNYCWELYGLGGGGGYYVHSRGTFASAAGRASRSDDNVVAGGFLGAGVTYNFTRQLFVGLEGKYLWTTNAYVNVDIGEETIHSHFNLEGVQGTVNLGYRF